MMNDRDKMDCYLTFHKQCLESYYQRKNFEWKFNLAFWAPLAILIGFMMQGQIANNPFQENRVALVLAHIWVFVLYFAWVIYDHGANKIDRLWAYGYKGAIEDCIQEPEKGLRSVTHPEKVSLRIAFSALLDWSPRVQIAITATLLVLSMWVFWQA